MGLRSPTVRVQIPSVPQIDGNHTTYNHGMVAKYTKEILEPIVASCANMASVMKALGLKQSGGNHSHLSKRVKSLNIDISHFTGSSHQRGKPSNQRLSCDKILVRDRFCGRKEAAARLKRAMIDSGIIHECCICRLEPLWQCKPLQLQIDHIDGNPLNNLKENLRFLCPNCHTQTANFGAKNARK